MTTTSVKGVYVRYPCVIVLVPRTRMYGYTVIFPLPLFVCTDFKEALDNDEADLELGIVDTGLVK